MKYHLDSLREVAKALIKNCDEHKVWCFYGQMGAGKTTLIKEICSLQGVANSLSSPSFGIVNEYLTSSGQDIYHFDFYRIRNEAEAMDIGIYEYFDSGSLCLIEWPENIEGLLDDDYLKISINLVSEFEREIKVSIHDREVQI